MPPRTPRACRERGCAGTTIERHGYCEAHAHKAKAFTNGRVGRGRGGRPWRRIRDQVRKRAEGLCEYHKKQGIFHAGCICDHIIPEAEGGRTELSNLQWICQSYSDEKTAAESQRGRARVS